MKYDYRIIGNFVYVYRAGEEFSELHAGKWTFDAIRSVLTHEWTSVPEVLDIFRVIEKEIPELWL